MNREQIKQLAERVASGMASEEELHLYNSIYKSLENNAVEEDDKSGIREEMRTAIFETIKPKSIVVPLYKRRWIAVAAIILILLGPALMYLARRDSGAEVVKNENIQLPVIKQNKTTLTLQDGTVIPLDDLPNDTIAEAGGARLIKLSDNSISYAEKSGDVTSYNTITTPIGEQYHLILQDGTDVWLNAASSLRFPTAFNQGERNVELTGEGYFEVKHDSKRPFKVVANHVSVNVLGTHFNINSYKDEYAVSTTLLQGSVRVEAGSQQLLIRPNEQVNFNNNSQQLQKPVRVNTDEVIAWKDGRLKFTQTPIDAIMRQVSRWYDVEVEYNGKMSTELFGGDVSKQQDVSQLLDILSATNLVSFEMKGRKIVVTAKK